MTEHFKYLYVQELNEQIQNRFSEAFQKIGHVNQMKRVNQSVGQRFYDYISKVQSMQRQYDSVPNQPNELNRILKKRKKNINESLQKYERNVKCKTMSDFKVANYSSYHPLEYTNSNLNALDMHRTSTQNPIDFMPIHRHTLLKRKSPHNLCKTQASFFSKAQVENQGKATQINIGINKKDKDNERLKSITKVINITVNNIDLDKTQKHSDVFTFAKSKANEHSVKQSQLKAIKKAIKFETEPNQISKKNQQSKVNKSSCNQKMPKFTLEQVCVKKIKERIGLNYIFDKQNKRKTKELLMTYEQQAMRRIELKQLILSSISIN